MSPPRGYAVIDTETTGLHTGYRHRIAEIAVVHVTFDGTITDEWSTLVNPERDLGPQAVHGITAAEVRHAPRFGELAGDVIDRLRGRVLVAHNWPFDAMHLRSEFERLDLTTPFSPTSGLCTMAAASKVLVGARRSLIDCCEAAGLKNMKWHTARGDAMAASALLQHFIARAPRAVAATAEHLGVACWDWPELACEPVTPVLRTPRDRVEPHFLARLADRIPRSGKPLLDSYLAMLDGALLDRLISATEADGLLDLAHELGLHCHEVIAAHRDYLRELARAAWADGLVTEVERADLTTVAALLGLAHDAVDEVLLEVADATGSRQECGEPRIGGLVFEPGDRIALTGDMDCGKALLREHANAVGLRVTSCVSRKTRVVVAADPDSLSGKAENARALGIPVVTEAAFLRAIESMYSSVGTAAPARS